MLEKVKKVFEKKKHLEDYNIQVIEEKDNFILIQGNYDLSQVSKDEAYRLIINSDFVKNKYFGFLFINQNKYLEEGIPQLMYEQSLINDVINLIYKDDDEFYELDNLKFGKKAYRYKFLDLISGKETKCIFNKYIEVSDLGEPINYF